MNRDLRYFLGLLSSKGARAVINLLFIALLARALGPDGLGEWAMVVAAGTLLHSLLLNWMHAPAVRFGREEWKKEGVINATWSARLPYLLVGFMFIFCIVLLDPAGWLERYFHLSYNLKPAVLLVSLWLWLSMETQNFLQLRQAMTRLAIVPVLVDGIPVLMLVVVLISAGKTLTVPVLITGLLALSVSLWGIVLWRELKELRIRWLQPDRKSILNIYKYAWPLIPGFLIGYISGWSNQLLLRYFFASREVGLFQAAYQVMVLLLGVAAPIGTILLPRLIDKEMVSTDKIRDFLSAAGPTVTALGLFLLIPLASFAPFCFQGLMGNKFSEAMPVFIVLCAAVPGSVILSLYGIFFNLQGRLWRSTVIYGGLISSINVLTALILLPRIGVLGSAVAVSASFLTAQGLYLFDQHRYYRLSSVKGCILFLVSLGFAVMQAMVGGGILARSMVCLLFLVLLVLLARTYLLLDRAWVMRIFSGKLYRIGNLVVRLTKA